MTSGHLSGDVKEAEKGPGIECLIEYLAVIDNVIKSPEE